MSRAARFARHDQLDNTGDLAYRKRAKHAGYTRPLISTNPALYDSDGELVDYSSEDERAVVPVREDPFEGIHLDMILRPLTSAEGIIDHPSLSQPFQSAGLTDLVKEAAIMLRTQRDALWRAKRLLKRLEGDADWAPCAMFETDADPLLLTRPDDLVSVNDTQERLKDDTAMANVLEEEWSTNGKSNELSTQQEVAVEDMALRVDVEPQNSVEGDADMLNGNAEPRDGQPQAELSNERQASADPDESELASLSATANMHAMTTRARARSPRASASASPSPSDSASVPNISPWFLAPSYTIPDRDLGLPADEAESTRKLLLLYCQKQEQTIRSLEILYSGLQRGDRLRKHIYDSAKAAGHLVPDGKGNMVTAMADGEDWYDEQDYGILGKGKDEVEDVEDENRRGGRRRRVVGRVNA